MRAQFNSDILRGSLQIDQPANPGAGGNFSYIVPPRFAIEILSCTFTLTTDANVANRNVTVSIFAPAGPSTYRCSPVFVQLATTTRTYVASHQHSPNTIIYPLALQLPIPSRYILYPNWEFATLVDGVQVGDQISGIAIAYMRHALPL